MKKVLAAVLSKHLAELVIKALTKVTRGSSEKHTFMLLLPEGNSESRSLDLWFRPTEVYNFRRVF